MEHYSNYSLYSNSNYIVSSLLSTYYMVDALHRGSYNPFDPGKVLYES